MQIENRIVLSRARDEVRSLLRDMILRGELVADERIEEIEMSRRIGVSRTPLREALIALERDGLVTSRPRRGYVVAPADIQLVRETYPILMALEAEAVHLAGSRLHAVLPDLREFNRRLATTSSRARQYELDRSFHERLCESCDNRRLLALLEVERMRAARFDGAQRRGTASQRQSCVEHQAIIAAIECDAFDEAVAVVRTHWEHGTEVVVRWLENVKQN